MASWARLLGYFTYSHVGFRRIMIRNLFQRVLKDHVAPLRVILN